MTTLIGIIVTGVVLTGSLCAIYVFIMGILAPLLILKSVNHDAAPRFTPYDPYEEAPPRVVLEEINKYYTTLTGLGFRLVGYLYQDGQVPGILSYLTIFTHPNGCGCMVVTMGPATPENVGVDIFSYLEFTSDFESGLELNTLNSATPLGTYASKPTKRAFQLASITDAAELWEAHQLFVRHHAPREIAKPLFAGDPITELTEGMVRDLDYQVSRGMFKLDAGRGKYVPTFTGAYRMTWKMIWPVLQIRKRLIARRNERLLSTLRETTFCDK